MVRSENFKMFESANDENAGRRSVDKSNNDDSTTERKIEAINFITYDFTLENVHNLEKSTNHLLSISYNNRQKMFIMLDPLGLVTWEWKKIHNSTRRVLSYPDFEYKHIIDVIYCKNHNCYFGLKGDYTLIVLNREFIEICSAGDSMRSILCMNYNPITDELITCGIDGVKIWCLKSTTEEQWKTTKSLASFKLVLKKEMNWIKNWIKRVEVDTINCHLYCCTRTDLFIYDFNGTLIRIYKGCHRLAITTCIYSTSAKVVLTGSEDTEIKVWSLAGGQIETFRGHTRCVTNLVLNPHNSNLVISSSLDGTIKMWSLDVMQQIYDLNYFEEHIIWMGLTEDKLLYAASPSKITIWSINNFVDFWSTTRDRINKIEIASTPNKCTRVLACSVDNAVRIFNRDTTKQLTTVLPVPKPNATKVISTAYSRNINIIYLLLDENEIWLYYTKTNPSTHIAVWNTLKLQERMTELAEDETEKTENNKKKTSIKPPKPMQLGTQNLLLNYRAIEYGLLSQEKQQECKCIAVLESDVIFYNEEGPCCPIVKTFLLLGLQNGQILFCDALLESKKYFVFNCNKDAVVSIHQDRVYNCLVTRVELKHLFLIQYWSLPDLELKKEFHCTKHMTTFARIDDNVMLGFSDGAIDLLTLKTTTDSSMKMQTLSGHDLDSIMSKVLRYEHREKVENVDACQNLKLFCSCSLDGCIKIWTNMKHLLAEISLDTSLSYACFLNKHGDLVVGWHNNLFFIYMHKILSQKHLRNSELNLDEDSEQLLSDDSSIIEDPSLKVTTYIDAPDVVTLKSYLYPFKINLQTDGWINIEKSLLKQPKKLDDADQRSESSLSSISTVPSSLYTTPRTPDDFLPNVDLTLTSRVRKSDVKNYLVEIFSKSLKKQKKYEWKLPRFGESPMSTPAGTPDTMSLETSFVEEEVVGAKDLEKKDQASDAMAELMQQITDPPKPFTNLRKKEDPEEMERKLRERMPVQFKPSDIKYTKIDSKSLIAQGLPSQSSSRRVSDGKSQQRPEAKQVPRRTSIRKTRKPGKPAQKKYLAVKEIRLNDDSENESPRRSSRQLKTTEERENVELRHRKRESIVGAKKSGTSKSGLDAEFDNETEEDEAKPKSKITTARTDEPITNADAAKSYVDAKPPRPGFQPSMPNRKNFLSVLKNEFRNVTSELRNIESTEPPDNTTERESQLKLISRKGNRTVSTQSFGTNFSDDVWDSYSGTKKLQELMKPREVKKIEYTEQEIKQINDLFSYFYGTNGPPKRIRSANNALLRERNTEKKEQAAEYSSIQLAKIELPMKKKNQNVFNYFDSLVEKHEQKRMVLNERVKSAQIRRENLQEESLKKWTASIEKKSKVRQVEYEVGFMNEDARPLSGGLKLVDVTFGNRSLMIGKRQVKSASILNKRKALNKRPKSVTFSASVHRQVDEAEETVADEKLSVQPDYLISAIEMEEILEEAARKALYRSQSQSSVTTIPSIYLKHLKSMHNKALFDLNQESMEQIYTISGTDDTSEELTETEDESFFRSYNRSSNSSALRKNTPTTMESIQINKLRKSPSKNMRINSCIVDYRSKGKQNRSAQATDAFESLSSYRLSMKSVLSDMKAKNRRYYNKEDAKNISENEEDEFDEYDEHSYSRYRLENASPDGSHKVKRRDRKTRSPSSIPNKCRQYKLIRRPIIKLKYKIPGYPECYLLPIRFPKLHTKIVSSLLKVKSASKFTKSSVVAQ